MVWGFSNWASLELRSDFCSSMAHRQGFGQGSVLKTILFWLLMLKNWDFHIKFICVQVTFYIQQVKINIKSLCKDFSLEK